jgi:NADH dehydrogenase [ubiquinone] 1 alpha subcomplex assembly factor 7
LSQRCSRFFSSKDGSQGPQEHHVQIDRSELYQWDKQPAETELAKVKQPETEFIRYLKDFIKIRGPIPVAEYMREVLTNPKFGYYMNRDVFGEKGDFTTSPEISQLFGEMVGIWVYSNWLQLGKPAQFRLVEFGPGRGTLMADVLRTASQFPGFSSAVSIHFIEASPYLKDMQYTSLLKCLKQAVPQPLDRKDSVQINGTHVSWHPSLETIPAGPTVVLAHEFFDALPVYQFQYTKRGWAERLVDLDTSLESPYHFRYVLAPGSTPAVVTFMRRARNMNVAEGDSVEVCPAGVAVAHDIAKRVGQHKGAALLVDYGENRALAQSLQAIRAHKFVDVFDNPGSADLSAWVDFNSLRYAAQSSKGMIVFLHLLNRSVFGLRNPCSCDFLFF